MILPPSNDEVRITFFEKIFNESGLKELDSDEQLNIANRFEKIESLFWEKNKENLCSAKVAIVSSSTSHFFAKLLKLYLYQHGIAPKIYESEYGLIYEQILNDKSELFSFEPDILLILPDYRDIKNKPNLFSSHKEIEKHVEAQYLEYKNLWLNLVQNLKNCQIIQGLFVIPNYRIMGSLESNYLFSTHNF